MNVEQVGLQLGVAGLLIYSGVKVALLLIANWREAEKERTKALADGFTGLIGKLDAHHTSDLQSHQAMATGIAEIKTTLSEWGNTPARGIPRVPSGGG